MQRSEKFAVLTTGFLVGLFVALLALGIAHWLNQHAWYSDGANLIQWAGGVSTFAGLGLFGWMYWSRRCGAPRCVRFGEHQVAGTVRKVCKHHHSPEHHRIVHALHSVEHAWGFSHLRDAA